MNQVSISKQILQHRQQAGLTQEQLANRLGVTKAAVSKWENGQSLPDIFLLPKLASFFNTSIDDLLGFSRQLTSAQIQHIYKQLSEYFATVNIDEALEKCEAYINDYYHCYPLLTKICGLYVNHLEFITNEDQRQAIIANIISLSDHIKRHSDDVNTLQEARIFSTLAYLMAQQPEQALNEVGRDELVIWPDSALRAQCYTMLGDTQLAQKSLQIGTYQHLLMLVQLLTDYMATVSHDEEQLTQVYKRIVSTIDVFALSELHPSTTTRVHYMAAICYSQLACYNDAFLALSQYIHDIKHHLFPIELKGDAFFTYIVDWFNGNNISITAPRDSSFIKQSLIQMLQHPAFTPLFEKVEYKQWLHDLSKI